MKPTELSQLHWVTYVQNIVKIASDLLQVVSCDGFLVLHGSLLSARFCLLQYAIEDECWNSAWRKTLQVGLLRSTAMYQLIVALAAKYHAFL